MNSNERKNDSISEKGTIVSDQILKNAREGKYRRYWAASVALFVAYCISTLITYLWWTSAVEPIKFLQVLLFILPLLPIYIYSMYETEKARKGTPGKMLLVLGLTGGITLTCAVIGSAVGVTVVMIFTSISYDGGLTFGLFGIHHTMPFVIAGLTIAESLPPFWLKTSLAKDGYVDLLKLEDTTGLFLKKWGAGSAVPLQEIADYFDIKKEQALRKLRALINRGFPGTVSGDDLILSDSAASTPVDYCERIRKKWESSGSIDVATIAKEFTMEPNVMAAKLKAWVKKGFISGRFDDATKVFLFPSAIKAAQELASRTTQGTGSASGLVSITRGFEVANETFKFFVRVENKSQYAVTTVIVDLKIPATMRFDNRSPSAQFRLGNISPGKYATAIYYIFCEACADEEINGFVMFNDPQGKPQVAKMEPFPITTCKFVKPREITPAEFREKLDQEDKKEISIPMKGGLNDKDVIQKIAERLTMSKVASASGSLDMFGQARDGSDVGMSTVLKEIDGIKTLVATVFSTNQHVMMGVLSDIMEEVRDIKADTGTIKQTTGDILATVTKILAVQLSRHDEIATKIDQLNDGVKGMNDKILILEKNGEFDKADGVQREISAMRSEMRGYFKQMEDNLGLMSESIERVMAKQELTTEILQSRMEQNDWEKIKGAWKEYKEGRKTMRDLLLGAAKELGKRALRSLVSALTGGIINMARGAADPIIKKVTGE